MEFKEGVYEGGKMGGWMEKGEIEREIGRVEGMRNEGEMKLGLVKE